MGSDDDADCVEHVWQLDQLHLTLEHAGQAHICVRCGAVRYDDAAQDTRREPLPPPR